MNSQLIIDFIRSLYPNRDIIPLHEPYFGGNEKKYVLDCIDSTYVSSVGKYVDKFEEMICEYTGAKFAVATVNGTAALHIALLLVGVKRGDLVITQPLTFIATCNAISYCGADSVFIDIDKKTLGLSADTLEEWLFENCVVENCLELHSLEDLELRSFYGLDSQQRSAQLSQQRNSQPRSTQLSQPTQPEFTCLHKQTKRRVSACVPMHTFGHPCEIDKIVEVCNKFHIPVVEDAAESIGSQYKNQHTGTFGKFGVLSFNGNKTITTGGGGMILTNDEELAKLAKHITTTAKKPHPWKFKHDMVGYNYRLPNINAALGCAQVELLPEILKNKRETANKYQTFFDQQADIEYVSESENSFSNYWLNVILLKDQDARDDFLKHTNENKVMTRPAWILMNKLSMFEKSICGNLSISEEIESCLVNIPSSFRLGASSKET